MSCNHQDFGYHSGGFSAERLVEFGMSAAVANQVLRTMNQTMAETFNGTPRPGLQYPGQLGTPGQTSQLYYAVFEGRQAGPFLETEIVRLINDGRITKETYIWHQGMREWRAAQDVPEILRVIALAPPPLPVAVPASGPVKAPLPPPAPAAAPVPAPGPVPLPPPAP